MDPPPTPYYNENDGFHPLNDDILPPPPPPLPSNGFTPTELDDAANEWGKTGWVNHAIVPPWRELPPRPTTLHSALKYVYKFHYRNLHPSVREHWKNGKLKYTTKERKNERDIENIRRMRLFKAALVQFTVDYASSIQETVLENHPPFIGPDGKVRNLVFPYVNVFAAHYMPHMFGYQCMGWYNTLVKRRECDIYFQRRWNEPPPSQKEEEEEEEE